MRVAMIAGFVAGILVSGVLIIAGVAYVLTASDVGTPRPSPAPSGAEPSATAVASATRPPSSDPSPGAPSVAAPSPSTGASSPASSAVPSAGPSTTAGVGLAVGDRAPALRVAQLGGGEIDTAQLGDQPLWVNFMATYCPSCRDELPLMERLQTQLGESMTILVVDAGEDVDTVATYMASLGVDLPVGVDPKNRARDAWGAYVLPVHYWVDASGVVRGYLFGPGAPEAFVAGVRTVLPDAPLEP